MRLNRRAHNQLYYDVLDGFKRFSLDISGDIRAILGPISGFWDWFWDRQPGYSLGFRRFLRSEFRPALLLAGGDLFLGRTAHFIFLLARLKRLTD